jgi:hypothetical protein
LKVTKNPDSDSSKLLGLSQSQVKPRGPRGPRGETYTEAFQMADMRYP